MFRKNNFRRQANPNWNKGLAKNILKDIERQQAAVKPSHDEFDKIWLSVKGQFLFRVDKLINKSPAKWSDYTKIKVLGVGGFGKVFLARDINTERLLALKMIKKSFVVKNKSIDVTINEKHILSICDFAFLLGYINSFQTNSYLCLVIELAPGGDLYNVMENAKPLQNNAIKFYTAQIVLALQYLTMVSIIHRDIKPQNVLIAKNGYIRLADFGVSKILKNPVTYTFTGTMEYMAPEVINGKGYGTSADWWSFGCLVYEMFESVTPFFSNDDFNLLNNITRRRLTFSSKYSSVSKDFMSRLLCIDVIKRLGCTPIGPNEARKHIFFESINWMELYQQKVKPPYYPDLHQFRDIDTDPSLDAIPEEDTHMKYGVIFKHF